MKKVNLFGIMAMLCLVLFACEKPDPTPGPGTDPNPDKPQTDTRLSDCTIAEIAFEGQTATPVIEVNGATATIKFEIDPTGIDMSAVKVTALSFRYNEPAVAPTASVAVGGTLDLNKKSADIVVTSKDGSATCTYTVTAESAIEFTVDNPFQGVVTFDLIGGIPWGSGQSFLVFIGGQGDPATPHEADIRMTTDAEIGDGHHAHKDCGGNDTHEKDYASLTVKEQDNVISFKYTRVDSSDGTTYGTYINNAGADGEYADFIYYAFDQGSRQGEDKYIDVTPLYRLLPKGKMLWSQAYQSNVIKFYEYTDTEYANPVSEVKLEKNGQDNFVFPYVNYSLTQWMGEDEVAAGKHTTIPVEHYAFHRTYEWHEWWVQMYPDKFTAEEGWSDTRYCVSNVRDIFWLVDISDAPAANHDDLLAQ